MTLKHHFTTFVELLRWRALHQPNRRVHTFLVDGETKEVHLTYGQLDRQARAIAARLQHLGATGQRALLIYPSGLDFIAAFFGCLYAGVTAVPVYPPDPARLAQTLPTLRGIAQDAEALFALTTSPFLAMANMMFAKDPAFGALHWLATDKMAHEGEDRWQPVRLNHDSLAFLQYTSGSTGQPKGVMISHGNLLHNLELIRLAGDGSSEARLVSWLPVYHDMGLIVCLLSPIYNNFTTTFMSPIAFLQRPRRWLQAISRIGATHSGAPNFAYDLCVRKTTPEQRKTLDLSQWRVAFNGAEPVRPETLERFVTAFEPCGFRRETFLPCYGLAEITVGGSWSGIASLPVGCAVEEAGLADNRVVVTSPDAPGSKLFVGCGHGPMDQIIRIVDPDKMTRCAAHQVGEIWISSPSVAQGYWNQPEKSAQTFDAYVADSGEGPFLRTGDLGFLLEGELFVTGRMKDMIVIRGQNYYPHDIEATVEQATSLLRAGCVAAFSIERDNQERLVIVGEVNKRAHPPLSTQIEDAVKAIRRAVWEQCGLNVYAISFLKPRSIPKTSSGKIQRQRCRMMFLEDRLQVIGAWYAPHVANSEPTSDHQAPIFSGDKTNPVVIQDWIIKLLNHTLNIPQTSIDPSHSFAELGLDSVMMVELAQQLQAWLPASQQIDATVAWNFPSIDVLARYLAADLAAKERKNGKNGKMKPKDSTDAEFAAKIETLSDDEMAALLLTELTLSQKRNA